MLEKNGNVAWLKTGGDDDKSSWPDNQGSHGGSFTSDWRIELGPRPVDCEGLLRCCGVLPLRNLFKLGNYCKWQWRMDKFNKKLGQVIPYPFHLPNPGQNFQQVLENRPAQNQPAHVPESPRSNADYTPREKPAAHRHQLRTEPSAQVDSQDPRAFILLTFWPCDPAVISTSLTLILGYHHIAVISNWRQDF